MKYLKYKGEDYRQVWYDIKQVIRKCFCSVQPILKHEYRSCQADDFYGGMCFEILGWGDCY